MKRAYGIWLLAGVALWAGAARAQWRTPWTYEKGPAGPAHWGDIDPDYASCKTDRAQSPIDITAARKTRLAPLAFGFHDGPVNLINNGYTAVRVDYAPGNGDTLRVGGTRYELTQFHFHHPSEETVDGKHYAMNAHFMMADAGGKIAGVTVFLKAGKENPAIAQLWAHMPAQKGPAHVVPGMNLNPGALLPASLGYYRYTGSVTAPPCNPNVAWFVLKTPVEMSQAQIDAFAKLYPDDTRAVQPLNGRRVEASE